MLAAVSIPMLLYNGRFIFQRTIPLARNSVLLSWTGACLVAFPVAIVVEFILLIDPQRAQIYGLSGLVVWVLVALYSCVNASSTRVRNLEIASSFITEPSTLIQISDVHIGSRDPGYLRKIVLKINALRPDYVVITGDLVDSNRITANDLQILKSLPQPKFFTIGNHERYEDCDTIATWMEALGFHVLRDESHECGPIQFIGIDDSESTTEFTQRFNQVEIQDNKLVVLFHHRPIGMEVAAKHGVRLMLSGHTHRGQIAPFNLIVRRFFKYTHGSHMFGDMTLHVNTGTGTWGPRLRLGSYNEITQITFTPI